MKFLKGSLLFLSCVLVASLIAVVMRFDAIMVQAQIEAPILIDSIRTDALAEIDVKLDPILKQYTATGEALAGTATEAKGLLADIRREIPTLEKSSEVEVAVINSKLDVTNQHVGELSAIIGQLKPTIDGLNLMFRRDAVPAQTLGLLGASKVAAGEVAQTMKVVRDTVKDEAAPTAVAIRESARGTAQSTRNAAQLISDSDKFVVLTTDLIYGKRTFWQRFRAFMWGVAQLGVRTSGAW